MLHIIFLHRFLSHKKMANKEFAKNIYIGIKNISHEFLRPHIGTEEYFTDTNYDFLPSAQQVRARIARIY